jgi:hypothetical protein
MLDAIAGAAGLVPGGQMLGLVSMGIELAKGLFDKGDVQGTQDMLKFLNEVVSKMSQPMGQATGQISEPLPFTSPADRGGPSAASNYRTTQVIDITIEMPRQQMGGIQEPQKYGLLPEVDGSPAGDKRFTDLMSARVDGNSANTSRTLTPGSAEWLTVGWAMQQNDAVRYNADTKEFSIRLPDGTNKPICTLAEAQSHAGPRGLDRNHPEGARLMGDFLNKRVNETINQPENLLNAGGADLQQLMQELRKLLQQFEDAQKMMRSSTVDITIHQVSA